MVWIIDVAEQAAELGPSGVKKVFGQFIDHVRGPRYKAERDEFKKNLEVSEVVREEAKKKWMDSQRELGEKERELVEKEQELADAELNAAVMEQKKDEKIAQNEERHEEKIEKLNSQFNEKIAERTRMEQEEAMRRYRPVLSELSQLLRQEAELRETAVIADVFELMYSDPSFCQNPENFKRCHRLLQHVKLNYRPLLQSGKDFDG